MYLWSGIDADRADDARQAEHVLCFEERTIGVTIYLDADTILTDTGKSGDVESCRIARVFGKAHVATVYPKIEERVNTVELDKQFLVLPRFRHVERTAIGAHLIAVLIGCPVGGWRTHHALAPVVLLDFMVEDDRLVDVDGCTISLLPVLLQSYEIPA